MWSWITTKRAAADNGQQAPEAGQTIESVGPDVGHGNRDPSGGAEPSMFDDYWKQVAENHLKASYHKPPGLSPSAKSAASVLETMARALVAGEDIEPEDVLGVKYVRLAVLEGPRSNQFESELHLKVDGRTTLVVTGAGPVFSLCLRGALGEQVEHARRQFWIKKSPGDDGVYIGDITRDKTSSDTIEELKDALLDLQNDQCNPGNEGQALARLV